MSDADRLPHPKGWGTRYVPLDRALPHQSPGMVALRDDRSGTVGVARFVRGPGDEDAAGGEREGEEREQEEARKLHEETVGVGLDDGRDAVSPATVRTRRR